jgi:hypothetical protein
MKYLILSISVLLFASCNQKSEEQETTRKNHNAVYYWKTTFRLSTEEQEFLKSHKIGRLYLRYFDVARDPDFQDKVIPIPEATLRFIDSIPSNLEVVPTVFIDNNLFKDCDMSKYAELLVKRILTMTETNDVPNVYEVQLDCDWTPTTEEVYFRFLQQVNSFLKKESIMLSTTIRLHQLKTKVPPVERGVLMCYNTGGIRNPNTANSILSAKDVAQYVNKNIRYSLPLDVAYPTFSWAVWFRNNKFQALLRDLIPENENLTLIKDIYKVNKSFYQEEKHLLAGDEIRFETSDFEEIMEAKKLLEKYLLKNHSIIIYHLDYNNLSKYTENEISKIYAH